MNAALRVYGLLLLGILLGCSGKSGLPDGETGTGHGKVTYKGQSIPAGSVVLFVGSKSGILGTGTTDSSGGYALTMRNESKILCGSYRIAVTPPNPNAGLSDDEIAKLAMENKLPKPPVVKEIPDAYRSPETTKQSADVKPGDNTIDIDLKD